jgi:hypothetical protein
MPLQFLVTIYPQAPATIEGMEHTLTKLVQSYWPESVIEFRAGGDMVKTIKKSEPSWLNQALNEGDGVYRP